MAEQEPPQLSFGEALSKAYSDRGYTQGDFARCIPLSQSQVSQFKNDRLNPNPEVMGRMLVVLKPNDFELDSLINPWSSRLSQNTLETTLSRRKLRNSGHNIASRIAPEEAPVQSRTEPVADHSEVEIEEMSPEEVASFVRERLSSLRERAIAEIPQRTEFLSNTYICFHLVGITLSQEHEYYQMHPEVEEALRSIAEAKAKTIASTQKNGIVVEMSRYNFCVFLDNMSTKEWHKYEDECDSQSVEIKEASQPQDMKPVRSVGRISDYPFARNLLELMLERGDTPESEIKSVDEMVEEYRNAANSVPEPGTVEVRQIAISPYRTVDTEIAVGVMRKITDMNNTDQT